jgi:flagellar motor switch protein FliN/FliY
MAIIEKTAQVNPAEFKQFETTPATKAFSNTLGNLMDVPVEMRVELGRASMTIKEILSLGEGSIIELDKLAGDTVDIYVNNKMIAKGEVVVIDENFGIRITEILDSVNRLADG